MVGSLKKKRPVRCLTPIVIRAVLALSALVMGTTIEPLADQLAATRIDSPAPPPSLETLGADLLQLVCRSLPYEENSHRTYEELTLAEKLHLRTASKCMCSAMMAAIRDHYTTAWRYGDEGAEADDALARTRLAKVPLSHLMRAVREVTSAAARTPVWATANCRLDADDKLARCADDNDARLCPGLGAMIMRMIEHSGGTSRHLQYRSFRPLTREHPCGKLSVESHGDTAGGVTSITLTFIKDCSLIASWSFYVGDHCWLLIDMGCDPNPNPNPARVDEQP